MATEKRTINDAIQQIMDENLITHVNPSSWQNIRSIIASRRLQILKQHPDYKDTDDWYDDIVNDPEFAARFLAASERIPYTEAREIVLRIPPAKRVEEARSPRRVLQRQMQQQKKRMGLDSPMLERTTYMELPVEKRMLVRMEQQLSRIKYLVGENQHDVAIQAIEVLNRTSTDLIHNLRGQMIEDAAPRRNVYATRR